MLRTEAVWRQATHPFVWKGSLYLRFCIYTRIPRYKQRAQTTHQVHTRRPHCPSASPCESPHALDLTSNKNSPSPFPGPHSQARASRQRLQEAPGGSHFTDAHAHRRTLVPPVLQPLHPALQRRDFPVLAEAVAEHALCTPVLCTPGANATRGSCAAVAAGSPLLRFCGIVCNVIKCNKDTANVCWGLQLPACQALGMVEAPAFKVPGWRVTWAERKGLQ